MALIKCSECGHEMSDHAMMCPKCGCENNIMICPDCGKQLSSKASMCPNCGRGLQNYNNSYSNDKGENYGLAIAALICSFFGITCLVGLILGIIVLNSNKGKNNTAKTFGLVAVIISSIITFIGFISIIVAASAIS